MKNQIIILSFFFICSLEGYDYFQSAKIFTIMLNPAGDAKDAGRTLTNSFERGVTLQFAQELKLAIEQHYNNVRVILTRIPGETLEFLQNANFANRLNVDFYLSIHFYKEKDVRSKVFLYYYLNEPFYIKSSKELSFIKYNHAHLINIYKTIDYGNFLKNYLEKNDKFDFQNLIGLPFKSLIGVTAPSIAFEAGLKESDNFKVFLEPLLLALSPILNKNIYEN